MADQDYAGDILPREAWDILTKEADARLVDVRTDAEWNFVGTADLSSLGKESINICWQNYPGMDVNEAFVDAVKSACPDPDAAILFLCRSGQRSARAAEALTAAGYKRCYNVAEGFEGDKNNDAHRGSVGGWKVANLPWKQN